MLLILGIAFLLVVVISGTAVAVGVRSRRRMFAGPARDAWDQARRDLSRGDQRQVQWATGRRRPVNRPALALPQLVYSRYAQYQAERSPVRRMPFRVGFAVLYVALAGENFVNGAVDPHWRIFHFMVGALFAFCAVMWALVVPRSASQGPARMKRLRQEIRERYPDW